MFGVSTYCINYMGFNVKFLKAITALVMVLGIIVQSVNAVGAPCPILSKLGSSPMNTGSAGMNNSNVDASPCYSQTNDDSSSYSKDDDNCCDEDNCPMNNGATGLLSLQSVVFNTSISYSVKTTEKIKFILPQKPSSLYRPPISA
jgi:hypothetical protein